MTETVATIEGYASLFLTPDLNGDVVMPGAFRAALRRKGPGGVAMLYQHAAEAPVGRWLSLTEDARGLYAVGELILSSETAREAYALLRGRALDGLSIGFQTVRAKKARAGGRRFIHEADLWEVSIVTFPMAPGARVLSVSEPKAALVAHITELAGVVRGAAAALEARGASATKDAKPLDTSPIAQPRTTSVRSRV